MNILAIGAHPDDVETMCAGTLAKYASLGHKVYIATATNGNIGSAHHTMEEIAKIRKQEAANSAALIGAEYTIVNFDASSSVKISLLIRSSLSDADAYAPSAASFSSIM